MAESEKPVFDVKTFLASGGVGREIVELRESQILFSQGNAADSVFYLQSGRAKLTVISKNGKEATITLLASGDFVGEESLASAGALHTSTATALTHCTALRIERGEMLRALHEEQPLSEVFMAFLLARGVRIQSDLVDQLFNSAEKRLARVLVVDGGVWRELGNWTMLLPEISEDRLAEMIGTSKSAVSFFMNRFRELGFISYDGRIQVHKSLLDVILHDRLPGNNAATPEIVDPARLQGCSITMEYSKLRSLLRRVIVVPMLVTTSLAGFLLWETFDLNKSMQWVDHTDRVLDQSGHLLKLLVDMESAKRGYIATGDETFLPPYLEGTKEFDSEFQALYQLVADNPSQQQRLKDIYAGYQESEEYDSRIIALRRAGKADPTLIENRLRKHELDTLREAIAEFQSVEEDAASRAR